MQTEIAAANDAAVPAVAKQAIALLGREVERIAMRRRVIDTTLLHQDKTNPLSRRRAAMAGRDPGDRTDCGGEFGTAGRRGAV